MTGTCDIRCAGFSLIELMISVAILTSLFGVWFTVLQFTTQSASVANAQSEALAEVRDVVRVVSQELQMARKNESFTSKDRVFVVSNPAPDAPIELVFQVPVDERGSRLSNPIRYRFENEDKNGNSLLDAGEDTVVTDGALTRRLLRIEEVAGPDGGIITTERVIAGANNLSSVSFNLDGDIVEVRVSASKAVAGTRRFDEEAAQPVVQTVRASLAKRVYLLN